MTKRTDSGPRRIGRRFLRWAVLAVLVIGAYEVLGQLVVFRNKMYFVHDVDHRMRPDGDEINGDGIRSRLAADDFREEDLNIVVLGDSFVFGARLPEKETIPAQLQAIARERHPGRRINVVNFGWFSASPLLSYRQLVDIGERYHPDVVLECIDMTDFHDDLKYRQLLDRDGIFALVGITPVTLLTVRRLLALDALDGLHQRIFGYPGRRFFHSRQPLAESAHYLETLRGNIEAIRDYSRDRLHARFVLAIFPRSYQYSEREAPDNWEADEYEPLGAHVLEPFLYFEQLQDRVDFPIHSLLPDFQNTEVFPTCYKDDPHWNVDGARIAAEALYQHLLADGLFNEDAAECASNSAQR